MYIQQFDLLYSKTTLTLSDIMLFFSLKIDSHIIFIIGNSKLLCT